MRKIFLFVGCNGGVLCLIYTIGEKCLKINRKMSNIKKIVNAYLVHRYPSDVSREFADWFAIPIDHKQKDEALKEAWDGVDVEASKLNMRRSYKAVMQRIKLNEDKVRRFALMRTFLRTAAVIVLAVAITAAVSIFVGPLRNDWNEVYVPRGESRMVSLSDGSTIRLTAGSRLIYPEEFNSDVRKVYLSGEAFADITKDEHRKFVVSAEQIDVVVHGTQFNIRSFDSNSEVEVMLLEGSVDMQTKSLKKNRVVRMHPGDFVKLDKRSGRISCENIPSDMFDSYPSARSLTFINSRLSDIAVQLERLFDVRIIFDNADLAEERYYSAFVNNESLDQILSTLKKNGRMSYYWRNGEIHFSK